MKSQNPNFIKSSELIFSFGINLRLAEFIQYLFPPSDFGPSSKTCPK